MIKRDDYLDKIIRNMWNGEIKVITGIRRCGKSVLLFDIFYEYLLRQGYDDNHIIKIALDQRKFYKFRNPIVLCEYVEGLVEKNKESKYFLLIDEVQFTIKVKDEKNDNIEVTIYDMLNELKSYKNLDVYVTGSNSKMLSKDIATEFRGRATQIHMYPLSFSEVYSYIEGDKRDALNQYMLYGGMPRIMFIDKETDKKAYLSNLYDEVYVKDIIERNSLEREDILNAILDYVASQIGSLTNPTNIANALTSSRNEKVNNALVSSYLDCAIDSFILTVAKRYDVKGKTYFNFPNKYYYCDLGLRNARLNYRQFDPGHIMENIIYNELIKRGYSVDVGVVVQRKNNEKINREVDFVVNNGDRRVYIQSAYQLENEDKINSELQSLKLTNDFFKKIVIRMDISHTYYDENGFCHCNLLDFLLGDVEIF